MIRRTALVALVFAVATLAFGTGGVTTMAVDRSADLSIVDDENAYVGIETTDRRLDFGQHEGVPLVTIDNRFDRTLGDVDVAIDGDENGSPALQAIDSPGALPPGRAGTVTATIACDTASSDPKAEHWTISISAASESVEIELVRSVTVSCAGNSGTDDAPERRRAGNPTPDPSRASTGWP